jgi:peptidoglycan/xylan/chitin deacetylase (PgdA/CDA1 family)
MNQPFKKFIKTVLFYTGLLALYRLAFCRESAVILAYHSVRPHKFSAEDNLNVLPQTFEKQMRYLASHYQVLSLAEVISILKAGRRFRRRTVVLTFDDGRRDNVDVAFPILKTFALPATFFVVTSRTDAPDENYFGWSDAQMLVRNRVAIGSHTQSHKRLTKCSTEDVRAELCISRARIVEKVGDSFVPFAYPFGDLDQRVCAEVRRSGYDCAVSTRSAFVHHGSDLFALPRIQIDHSSAETLPLFATQLVHPPRQS